MLCVYIYNILKNVDAVQRITGGVEIFQTKTGIHNKDYALTYDQSPLSDGYDFILRGPS